MILNGDQENYLNATQLFWLHIIDALVERWPAYNLFVQPVKTLFEICKYTCTGLTLSCIFNFCTIEASPVKGNKCEQNNCQPDSISFDMHLIGIDFMTNSVCLDMK